MNRLLRTLIYAVQFTQASYMRPILALCLDSPYYARLFALFQGRAVRERVHMRGREDVPAVESPRCEPVTCRNAILRRWERPQLVGGVRLVLGIPEGLQQPRDGLQARILGVLPGQHRIQLALDPADRGEHGRDRGLVECLRQGALSRLLSCRNATGLRTMRTISRPVALLVGRSGQVERVTSRILVVSAQLRPHFVDLGVDLLYGRVPRARALGLEPHG